jgi:signal peptidase I
MWLLILCILLAIIMFGTIFYHEYEIDRVDGFSMHPTFKDGQHVVSYRYRGQYLKKGSVYVFLSPDNRYVIKRLDEFFSPSYDTSITLCWFLGDNPSCSYDSRNYGWVNADRILAEVVPHFDKRRMTQHGKG